MCGAFPLAMASDRAIDLPVDLVGAFRNGGRLEVHGGEQPIDTRGEDEAAERPLLEPC